MFPPTPAWTFHFVYKERADFSASVLLMPENQSNPSKKKKNTKKTADLILGFDLNSEQKLSQQMQPHTSFISCINVLTQKSTLTRWNQPHIKTVSYVVWIHHHPYLLCNQNSFFMQQHDNNNNDRMSHLVLVSTFHFVRNVVYSWVKAAAIKSKKISKRKCY